MNPNEPPPHKSERMFRRYEKALQAIVANYPASVSFDPKEVGLATTTFSCRLRDAALSLFEYHWTSPVDETRLKEVWDSTEVISRAGMVVVCPRGTRQALSKVNEITDIQTDKDDFIITLDDPTDQEIVACALLIDKKKINKPIKVKNCSIERIQHLTKALDVAVTNDNRGFIVML